MAGNINTKIKLLRLYDILCEKTDEENPMSANDICKELSFYGINAERKSIYNDILVLQEYGYDIIKASGSKKGFYLGERDYQLAEVRLLVDAVQSAKFITESKTEELIAKIMHRLSKSQKKMLGGQVYVDHRNKRGNEKIYYAIDALAHAVEEGCKVRIHYTKRRIETGEQPKNEEHIYTVSPYALIWANDHYYLVCNNAKYDNLMHLRIDKITSVAPLDERARSLSEVSQYKGKFDAADYSSKVFNMFAGEEERIIIRCVNSLWDAVRDRFGEDVRVFERTDDTFTIAVNAAVSEGLISWIMQYGEDMVVEKPISLREAVLSKAKALVKAYE
ncbi:MAG: WYL domain-containing protein [Ruminococcaceae bacterium]|nr:WYL domain-containing protein [Oscillospiraceae bacterium]